MNSLKKYSYFMRKILIPPPESKTTYIRVGLFEYGRFSGCSNRLPTLCTYKSAPCSQHY